MIKQKAHASILSCHNRDTPHNNRVVAVMSILYREGLHILMNTRLIKLILAKQVVYTKNTLKYLSTGPNWVAIAM